MSTQSDRGKYEALARQVMARWLRANLPAIRKRQTTGRDIGTYVMGSLQGIAFALGCGDSQRMTLQIRRIATYVRATYGSEGKRA